MKLLVLVFLMSPLVHAKESIDQETAIEKVLEGSPLTKEEEQEINEALAEVDQQIEEEYQEYLKWMSKQGAENK